MWFLQTDTLFMIAGVCVLVAALRWADTKIKLPVKWIFPALETAVLCYVSVWLAVFQVLYTFVSWLLTVGLVRLRRGKGIFMVSACLMATVPFLFNRLESDVLPFAITGIAFSMLKVIDAMYYVYYGHEKISFPVFLNYMLFLPVFTAGPVFRYREFLGGFEKPSPLTSVAVKLCVMRIIRGLFKKVVLVSAAMIVFDHLRGMTAHWYISLSITILSYIVLYLDLSGYSDVAIALSAVCGIKAPENFKRPWMSPTLSQFWRSWHVSVSDFIREHIYVVASRKKMNRLRSGLIGLAAMTVMALWHDFSVLYLIAGLYNGVLLLLENLLGQTTVNRRKVSKPYFAFRCVLTNMLFALNTLVFTLKPDEIIPVLRGFFSL